MTFKEIGLALGISEFAAKWTYQTAMRKIARECRRQGLSADDIVGMPQSMLARAETWA